MLRDVRVRMKTVSFSNFTYILKYERLRSDMEKELIIAIRDRIHKPAVDETKIRGRDSMECW